MGNVEGEVGVSSGLTRREALRKGTYLGAGAVWAAPVVRTLTMSQDFAAQTSAAVEPIEDTPPVQPTVPPVNKPPAQVGGISVTQPNPDQVEAGNELPLTGLDVADAAILGAGLLAAGAALLKATEPDKGQPQS